MRNTRDVIFERGLSRVNNPWNLVKAYLLKTQSVIDEENQHKRVIEDVLGEAPPLKNEKGIKAFAVCAKYDENDPEKNLSPFLLRTYESPNEEDALDGTCDIDFPSACHATSSLPGVLDLIKLDYKDKKIVLADGCFVANCPVAIAIKEAQQLWPSRKIGVVLSIGVDRAVSLSAYKAIDMARIHSPNLTFHRILAFDALREHNGMRFNEEANALLESKTKNYLQNTQREKILLKNTFDALAGRDDDDTLSC